MKKLSIVLTIFVLIQVSFTVAASAAGDSTALLRIKLSRDLTYSDLVEKNVDILAKYPDGRVDVAVTEMQRQWITMKAGDYTLLETRMLKASTDLDFNLGLYHTYAETEAMLSSLAVQYPGLTRIDTLGTSIEGRTILAIKISDNADIDEDEAEVLIMGCHHARELMSVEVPLLFAEYLLDNYGTDSQITELVNTREVWVVPIINPDGHVYVQLNHTGDWWTWWRKNRRNNGDGTFGVDLNRNYSYMWGYDNSGSSPSTSSETYRGTAAFSEPESQAVRNFCASHSFSVALSYHSYGELVLYPWGYVPIYTDDHEFFAVFADSLKRGIGYTPGCTAMGVLYPTNGDTDDWAYGEGSEKNSFYCFTIELNSYEEGGFGPPDTMIQPTFEKVLELNLTLLRRAGEPFSVLGPESPVLSEVTPLANPDFMLNWSGVDAADPNFPAHYEITEYKNLSGTFDPCELGDTLWTQDGFTLSTARASGGSYSFYSGSGNNLISRLEMTTAYSIALGDTLHSMLWYDIENDWDYAYLEASLNQGLTWETVPGNITTNTDPHGSNRGNGITGNSGGWIQGRFYLREIPGIDDDSEILLRFAYITDSYEVDEGIYIDDVSPVTCYEAKELLTDAVQDTFYLNRPDETGDFAYQVLAVDDEGHRGRASNIVFHSVIDLTDDEFTPSFKTILGQNYPNPFNPGTMINFSIGNGETGPSGTTRVRLDIFDVSGRRIAIVVDRELTEGDYSVRWNGESDSGRRLASGIYFMRLAAGQKMLSKKMILLR